MSGKLTREDFLPEQKTGEDRYELPREWPNNIEAEQALIGAILLNNNAYDAVADFLAPEHFFDGLHGRIFQACGETIKNGGTATPITLKEIFERDDQMKEIGGPMYLVRLAGAGTSIINVAAYAQTIADLAVRRGLILAAEKLMEQAYDLPIDTTPQAMAEAAEAEISDLATRGASNNDMRTLGSYLDDALAAAADAYQNGAPIGLSTGLPSLDELIGPMTKGQVIVLGGATSMGKSALAQQIANYNGSIGETVAVFSLEMMGEELATRSIATHCGVPAWRIESGKFTESEWERIEDARAAFNQYPIYIDEKRGLKISQIRSRALRLKRKRGKLGLVVLDHLQFIRAEREMGQQSAQLEQITRDVKAMAGDLKCPVILVSHVSRETTKRDDKRPQMSDLHGSSGIEKDADAVLFVHRPEYYLERSMPEEGSVEWPNWQLEMAKWKGKGELILAKRRKGKGSGTRRVNFSGDTTSFEELPENIGGLDTRDNQQGFEL